MINQTHPHDHSSSITRNTRPLMLVRRLTLGPRRQPPSSPSERQAWDLAHPSLTDQVPQATPYRAAPTTNERILLRPKVSQQ